MDQVSTSENWYLSGDEADELERDPVRPGHRHELVPPPRHHLRHEETGQEGDRDGARVLPRVDAHQVEELLPAGVVHGDEDGAVEDGEEEVDEEEDDHVVPEQLKDGAAPDEEVVPNAIELPRGVLVPVVVDVVGALQVVPHVAEHF